MIKPCANCGGRNQRMLESGAVEPSMCWIICCECGHSVSAASAGAEAKVNMDLARKTCLKRWENDTG